MYLTENNIQLSRMDGASSPQLSVAYRVEIISDNLSAHCRWNMLDLKCKFNVSLKSYNKTAGKSLE